MNKKDLKKLIENAKNDFADIPYSDVDKIHIHRLIENTCFFGVQMKSIEKLIDNGDLKIKKFRPVNDDYDTRYIDILYFKSEIICFFNYDSDEKCTLL